MRIVFIGTSELGIPSLEALSRQAAHEILVITKPDQRAGRGRRTTSSPLKHAARTLKLECLEPEDINAPEVLAEVEAFKANVLVVASYWAKLSNALLELPPFGGINIHPSLLPRYRGASPVPFALLNGDPVTGVTLFRMGSRMDAGDILGQTEIPVASDDNLQTLHDKLAEAAAPLLLRVLTGLEEGTVVPMPQDASRVVLAPKLAKKDGAISWEKSAVQIDRLVRAFTPWPGAFTFYRCGDASFRLTVTVCKVLDACRLPTGIVPGQIVEVQKGLVVACAEGLLEITRLKREGKKEMSSIDFLRGFKVESGAVLG